jgi:flagellar basal-body rod protein FlgC
MINPLSTSLSGLMAASKKLAVSAMNVANARTAGSLDKMNPNQPYLALTTVDTGTAGGGIKTSVVLRTPATVPMFDPDAPFANEDGMVSAPNVSLDEEMFTMIQAKHAYQANAIAISREKDMQDELRNALDRKV